MPSMCGYATYLAESGDILFLFEVLNLISSYRISFQSYPTDFCFRIYFRIAGVA